MWMLMCTNWFWVKMTTHNEKTSTCTLIFCMSKITVPATSLYWLEHLLVFVTYLLLNFEKKNLLWPIFYRWCWWMNSKDKKFKTSSNAFRSWCWIRSVTVCTQLLLNCLFCPFHRAESPEKPLVWFCSPQGVLGHCRERDLVFLGWVGWAALLEFSHSLPSSVTLPRTCSGGPVYSLI